MDRDIVLRYLLQVGRSFYTTHEFAVANKPKPVPHIPLKFKDAVAEFLKVKPPKKRKTVKGRKALRAGS